MNEDRPIIFTVKELQNGNYYSIETDDQRGCLLNEINYPKQKVLWKMQDIARRINNAGHAVLFEVE